ncbi:MAG: putative nucleotidyltransferase with HDIG domain [Shewanella sp.]|jgi:putative nucleotidyltransferase with HDIG domain
MPNSCKVAVTQLQVGNFIRLPISWKDHPFLFSSFKIRQQAQIELIKNLGIEYVFVILDRSDTAVLTPEDAKTRKPPIVESDLDKLSEELTLRKAESIEAHKSLRRQLQKTEQHFDRSIAMIRSLTGKLRNRPLNAVNDAKELIHNICEQLLSSDKLVLHLMSDAKSDDGIYFHSLNVSVLSMLIAKELNWTRNEIELVGIGALFHDTGKLKVPTQILRKRSPLSQAEQNFVNQHPLMGVDLLKLADNFPSEALPIILNHHEFLDGSGYPKGLKEPEIDKLSQLVAAVNTYDNLCHSDRSRKARTPYSALGYLYKHYQTQLNPQIVGRMVKMLGIYPPGSIVELSSGQYGMVMSVNMSQLLLPRILVYDALVPKEQAPIVELAQEGISIVRCLPPAALPEKVFKYLNPRERVSYYFGTDS